MNSEKQTELAPPNFVSHEPYIHPGMSGVGKKGTSRNLEFRVNVQDLFKRPFLFLKNIILLVPAIPDCPSKKSLLYPAEHPGWLMIRDFEHLR